MYGYVVMNKPEMKIREYDCYRSYYCGLCKSLKRTAGIRGQLALSYDMTFLALLLTALYEPDTGIRKERCVAHPVGKQCIRTNECVDYAADMSLLLAWYKCKDDYADEKKIGKGLYGGPITQKVCRIKKKYDRQSDVVKCNIEKLERLEKERVHDIDILSGCFGEILSEIFVMKQDEWEGYLRHLGFYLGKFIYILDAYDDLELDKKKKCFNPLLEKEAMECFDDWVKQLLIMAATEFAKAFEKLPIVEDVEILRNIIYSGVFFKYEGIRKARTPEMEEKNEESL